MVYLKKQKDNKKIEVKVSTINQKENYLEFLKVFEEILKKYSSQISKFKIKH